MIKIMSITDTYMNSSLDLVEEVFTDYSDKEEGLLVRSLIEEIRNMDTYIPILEIIALNENDEIIGYAMFSGFHIEGKYKDDLLLLSPVAVKTNMQRRHISKDMIEYGFDKSIELGYKAVIVEGNPQNYKSRGFVTSSDYDIVPGESVDVPAVECLMVKELVPGALERIKGVVEYEYKTLKTGGN